MPRHHRRTAIVAPIALAASAALVAGCTGDLQGPGADGSWYAANEPYAGQLEIEGFAATDPIDEVRHALTVDALGTAVEVSLGSSTFDARSFASAAESGDAPDLIYANRSDIGYLAARGVIMPLERCIEGEPINLSEYDPAALGQATLQERIFALPDASTVPLVLSGSDAPTERGGAVVEAAGADLSNWHVMTLWAAAEGLSLVSPDGRTATFDDPRIVAAIDRWAGGDEDAEPAEDTEPESTATLVDSQQLRTSPAPSDDADTTPGVSPVVTTAGEPVAVLGGYGWAIPIAGANPSVACGYAHTITKASTWLDATAGDDEAEDGAAAPSTAGLLTGNQAADAELRDRAEQSDDARLAALQNATDDAYAVAVAPPVNPADVRLTRMWGDAVALVVSGEATAEEALTAAQTEAQLALDTGWADLEAALPSR